MGRDAQFSCSNELCFSKWNALWGKKLLRFVLYFQRDCMWHSDHLLHDRAVGCSRSFIACTRHAVTSHIYRPRSAGNGLLNVWVRFYLWNQAFSCCQRAPFSIEAKISMDQHHQTLSFAETGGSVQVTAVGHFCVDKTIMEEDQAMTSCKLPSLERLA